MQNQPYALAASSCLELTGYRSHDPYPMRSPLVVADFLVDQLAKVSRVKQGEARPTFTEIGTRDGDNIACVAQLAASRQVRVRAMAVEQSPRRCDAMRVRADALSPSSRFRVVEAQVNQSTYLQALPPADVYYYWGITSTNVQMVRWMDEAARARGVQGTAFLGFDWHYPSDRLAMAPTLLALRAAKGNGSATVHRLFFDESEGREDVVDDAPIEPTEGSEAERRATYMRPFAKRPGRWGVFHIVAVRVGAGTARLPEGAERHIDQLLREGKGKNKGKR